MNECICDKEKVCRYHHGKTVEDIRKGTFTEDEIILSDIINNLRKSNVLCMYSVGIVVDLIEERFKKKHETIVDER